jgi:hypothetical protein
MRWRLRPLPVYAVQIPFRRPFRWSRRLAIDNTDTWFWVAICLDTDCSTEQRIHTLQGAIIAPLSVILPDMIPRRKIRRQHPPLTTGSGAVEDGIQDFTCHIDGVLDPVTLHALREHGVDLGLAPEALAARYPITSKAAWLQNYCPLVAPCLEPKAERFLLLLEQHIARLRAQHVRYAEIMLNGLLFVAPDLA